MTAQQLISIHNLSTIEIFFSIVFVVIIIIMGFLFGELVRLRQDFNRFLDIFATKFPNSFKEIKHELKIRYRDHDR